jgi:hypothetical protein
VGAVDPDRSLSPDLASLLVATLQGHKPMYGLPCSASRRNCAHRVTMRSSAITRSQPSRPSWQPLLVPAIRVPFSPWKSYLAPKRRRLYPVLISHALHAGGSVSCVFLMLVSRGKYTLFWGYPTGTREARCAPAPQLPTGCVVDDALTPRLHRAIYDHDIEYCDPVLLLN